MQVEQCTHIQSQQLRITAQYDSQHTQVSILNDTDAVQQNVNYKSSLVQRTKIIHTFRCIKLGDPSNATTMPISILDSNSDQ